jgi:putative CocE/NonD family hydrolase
VGAKINDAMADIYHQTAFMGGVFRRNLVLSWLNDIDNSDFVDEIVAHPLRDAFWEPVGLSDRFDQVNVPVIHQSGWWDIWVNGAFENNLAINTVGGPNARGRHFLIVGPWTHTTISQQQQGQLFFPPSAQKPASLNTLTNNFMAAMVGFGGTSVYDQPKYNYYLIGDVDDSGAPGNVWLASDEWPPTGVGQTTYYLRAGGLLSPATPTGSDAAQTSYVSDPSDPVPTIGGANLYGPRGPYDQQSAEARADVLAFSTPPLSQPLTITGPVRARLHVSSTALDTDFMVKIMDVYPDGRSMLMNEGLLKMRHRIGFDREDLMTPGEVYEIELLVGHLALALNAGHRLRISIASTNFPRFEPNPQTGSSFRLDDPVTDTAANTVHHSPQYPSRLILPTIGSGVQPPAAVDDSISTDVDVPAVINVLSNDLDSSGTGLDVDRVTQPPHGGVTINANDTLTYTPDEGFSGVDVFTYTVIDGNSATDIGTVTVTVNGQPGEGVLLISNFNGGPDGFVYQDDTFRSTSASSYESGAWNAGGGLSGGGLTVTLGGIDNNAVNGMSGGWSRSFTLTETSDVSISFLYNLTQSPNYESDELSEALVRVDGTQPGTGGTDYVARITGNGEGGPNLSTGWQLFETDLGPLGAGSHTLIIGGHNNRKTAQNETTTVQIDDVVVATLEGTGGPGSSQIDVAIATSSNDAEESASGSVSLSSSDLELVQDGSNQTVGLRFQSIAIPQGAEITAAHVQFTTDETGGGSAALVIRGHDTNDAPTFTSSSGNVSTRPRTSASVPWNPPAWNVVGESGAAQRTPNLAPVIQEIVDRGGWSSGNDLALIITGSGKRVAEAHSGGVAVLHVEFNTGGGGPPSNQAPMVNAGVDQTITLPNSAALSGTVSDDGLPNPPASVTTTWSKLSGPGTVTFGNASALNTTATFSQAGDYTLRLTGFDSALSGVDDVLVTVFPEGGVPVSIDVRISQGNADAEERISNGNMYLNSSDLELVDDGSREQAIGLLFESLQIPKGALIQAAHVQFQADESTSSSVSLVIQGQASDDAAIFSTSTGDISNRPRTGASVNWSPPAWSAGQAGAAQRTPDIKSIIQQIVNRPGWSSGNDLAIILTGSGRRTAEAHNGQPSAAPLLHVEHLAGN